MIQMGSKLEVVDNSGAKKVRCIKVLGGSKKMHSGVGSIIKISVIQAIPNASVKSGTVYNALVVNTVKGSRSDDGGFVRCNINSVILLDNNKNMIGTRVFGPVSRKLRVIGFNQVVSLAKEVI